MDEEKLGVGLAERTMDEMIPPAESLSARFLKDAIQQGAPEDRILQEYGTYVAPRVMAELIATPAKGGEFVRQLKAQGKDTSRSEHDQSLTSHLLNGLFPVARLAQRLRTMDTSTRRYLDDTAYRLFLIGFTLHDWNKLPGMREDLQRAGVDPDRVDVALHRAMVAPLIEQWMTRLGLDVFFDPRDPSAVRSYLDDIFFITANTQCRWGTHRNLSQDNLHRLSPRLPAQARAITNDLSTLADLLSSAVKHPEDIRMDRFHALLDRLSDGHLQFTYHRLAENRGVLTNIINNAVLDLFQQQGAEALLFFPHGAVYVKERAASQPAGDLLPDAVVEKIRKLCAGQLQRRYTGFDRDGKGLKVADYYHLFFALPALIRTAVGATFKILTEGKAPASGKRSQSLQEFQQRGYLPGHLAVSFPEDIRIDQLAEFCDLTGRKIWGTYREKLTECLRLKRGKKGQAEQETIPTINLVERSLIQHLQADDLLPGFLAISRLNEAIKEGGGSGNTGGVPLHWYFLAARYLERHPGLSPEDIRELLDRLADDVAKELEPLVCQWVMPDGWDDLRTYARRVVSWPAQAQETAPQSFMTELQRYQMAKKVGRGGENVCSICHSDYAVAEQMEASILFAPQVFTNKQPLFGSKAKRYICSICSAEMMLRQILMNPTGAAGADFEGRKFRYLYLYPSYFFTPETVNFMRRVYTQFGQTHFTTGIRDHLLGNKQKPVADFSLSSFQHLDEFLIEEDYDPEKERIFKLSYPNDQPITSFFFAMPPGDDTDTESWVMPTFLGLVLPLIFDTKVVVSESPVPVCISGADFPETVVLDAPHQFVSALVTAPRLLLDELLPNLQALTAAYCIHLDINTKRKAKGYSAEWGKLGSLARDLATSPLHVFHCLATWMRKQGIESPPATKIDLYLKYYRYLDREGHALTHPQRLVELYRKFYRGKGYKANALLKPIDESAAVISLVDAKTTDEELVQNLKGRLHSLWDRVIKKTAEGYSPLYQTEAALGAIHEYSEYFVLQYFRQHLRGDRARLSGNQLNLLRDTCEVLYREMEIRERRDKVDTGEEVA